MLLLAGLVWWWSPWPDRFTIPNGGSIHTYISGAWGWAGSDTCGVNHHTITVDSTRTVLTLVHARPWFDSTKGERVASTVYAILDVGRSHVTGAIRGEHRRSPTGAPVVWDLVLTGPDQYQGKQAGFWGVFGYTTPIRRCPPEVQWPAPLPITRPAPKP